MPEEAPGAPMATAEEAQPMLLESQPVSGSALVAGTPSGLPVRIQVLAVEAEPGAQALLNGLFGPEELYDLVIVGSGEEALASIHSSCSLPDVVLLGVSLHDASGLQVCAQLRQLYSSCELPIIMTPDQSDEGIQGLELGANDYMIKPLRHNELVARIRTQLALKRSVHVSLEALRNLNLLRSILPSNVISQLKQGVSLIAEYHEEVTILFSDICGFTNLATDWPTERIIFMLNEMFTAFDKLCEEHGVYKIETIGDAYMIVAGHDGAPDHAARMMGMAKAMLEAVGRMQAFDGRPIHVRIGIHTGPAHSGVVGLTRPRYCFFGDTVNTASRMESTGFPMAVQISAATHCALQAEQRLDGPDEFVACGKRLIKGKGNMETYLCQVGQWREAMQQLAPRDPAPCDSDDLLSTDSVVNAQPRLGGRVQSGPQCLTAAATAPHLPAVLPEPAPRSLLIRRQPRPPSFPTGDVKDLDCTAAQLGSFSLHASTFNTTLPTAADGNQASPIHQQPCSSPVAAAAQQPCLLPMLGACRLPLSSTTCSMAADALYAPTTGGSRFSLEARQRRASLCSEGDHQAASASLSMSISGSVISRSVSEFHAVGRSAAGCDVEEPRQMQELPCPPLSGVAWRAAGRSVGASSSERPEDLLLDLASELWKMEGLPEPSSPVTRTQSGISSDLNVWPSFAAASRFKTSESLGCRRPASFQGPHAPRVRASEDLGTRGASSHGPPRPRASDDLGHRRIERSKFWNPETLAAARGGNGLGLSVLIEKDDERGESRSFAQLRSSYHTVPGPSPAPSLPGRGAEHPRSGPGRHAASEPRNVVNWDRLARSPLGTTSVTRGVTGGVTSTACSRHKPAAEAAREDSCEHGGGMQNCQTERSGAGHSADPSSGPAVENALTQLGGYRRSMSCTTVLSVGACGRRVAAVVVNGLASPDAWDMPSPLPCAGDLDLSCMAPGSAKSAKATGRHLRHGSSGLAPIEDVTLSLGSQYKGGSTPMCDKQYESDEEYDSPMPKARLAPARAGKANALARVLRAMFMPCVSGE